MPALVLHIQKRVLEDLKSAIFIFNFIFYFIFFLVFRAHRTNSSFSRLQKPSKQPPLPPKQTAPRTFCLKYFLRFPCSGQPVCSPLGNIKIKLRPLEIEDEPLISSIVRQVGRQEGQNLTVMGAAVHASILST